MTPERWRIITETFQAALRRPIAERPQFLEEACAGDTQVHAEVRAMLAAHDRNADQDVPVVVGFDEAEAAPGEMVGPYAIHGLIGAGGMGRVYRARDPRLDRDVAVKVLPSRYATDAGRLRRFEQEARASGALTHPNLLTVYDVGTDNGRPYLVTELLDGETLRHRLERGAIPVSRARDIAAALARGLAAAHAGGIVHRDLKPENVIITREGRVKILDFGVAKLRARDAGVDGGSPWATPTVQTESGVVVGTAGYMAPEQIRGAEADGRADVFALGTILFEMLSGRRAFDRPCRTDTLDATLHADPLGPETTAQQWPTTLFRVVERCLEKDPDARFQSAADLAFALETMTATDTATRGHTRAARGLAVPIAAGAGLLVAVAAAVAALWRPPEPETGEPLARFAISVGSNIRYTNSVAISPDGTTIVYTASEGLIDSRQLFVRRIDQIATMRLPGTERAARPFFSPDGESIAFFADDTLKRTRLDGTTTPIVICAVEAFLGGTWASSDVIVFGAEKIGLQQVDARGGTPAPVTGLNGSTAEMDLGEPAMLPGGRAMLLTVHEPARRFRVDALELSTGARRTVVEDGFGARYFPATGHLVYATGNALFAAPFNPERLERSGPSVQLLDNVETNGFARYALSETGTLVFLPEVPQDRRTVAWVDRSGRTEPIPIEPRAYYTPRLSPDGRRFAVVVDDQSTFHIWIYGIDTGTFSRLTSEGRNWSPVWSHDSTQLFYVSERNGQWKIVREPVDSRAPAEELAASTQEELTPGAVSPDGRSLIYIQRLPDGSAAVLALDLTTRRAAPVAGLPDRVAMPILSPDGRWLGITTTRPPRPSIVVQGFRDGGPARQLIEGAGYTVWNRAGDRLYFRSRRGGARGSPEDGVFELPFDARRGVASGPERQLFRKVFTDYLGVPGFDVAADGRFLMVVSDGEPLQRDPHVLLHVRDELRRRAPSAGR